ncbi:hypothetical protein IC614_08005 [Allosphingosinicella flava]|uniref:Uncharacterized protein n=1 Tax=Allosphingosinicella flava TaxID=2771430 RepID=A0A7T2GIF1_9SPHN|nr:hypothetical protein [Sphingosinicella flava]QPQ54302.1 hypothetical protein IC614_08005 [Sphingosinicella flava]
MEEEEAESAEQAGNAADAGEGGAAAEDSAEAQVTTNDMMAQAQQLMAENEQLMQQYTEALAAGNSGAVNGLLAKMAANGAALTALQGGGGLGTLGQSSMNDALAAAMGTGGGTGGSGMAGTRTAKKKPGAMVKDIKPAKTAAKAEADRKEEARLVQLGLNTYKWRGAKVPEGKAFNEDGSLTDFGRQMAQVGSQYEKEANEDLLAPLVPVKRMTAAEEADAMELVQLASEKPNHAGVSAFPAKGSIIVDGQLTVEGERLVAEGKRIRDTRAQLPPLNGKNTFPGQVVTPTGELEAGFNEAVNGKAVKSPLAPEPTDAEVNEAVDQGQLEKLKQMREQMKAEEEDDVIAPLTPK